MASPRPLLRPTRAGTHRAIQIALQILLAVVVLLPFFWMVSVSLKPASEPFAIPARLWPAEPTLANYGAAFRPEFRQYFLNSMIVSGATLAITVPLGLLAAYAFTRFQTALLSALMIAAIVAQMFPSSAIIIPLYKLVRQADLLNTYASLIMAYITVTLPVSIWLLRGFVGKIPVTLEESAAIDGARPLRAFVEIVLPLCRPGIVATAVFVLIVTWQEFLFALSFTSTADMRTLSVGMNDFIGQYGIRYGELMASAVMVSLPVVLVFLVLQRQFVSGLTAGALKG
ncbi:MAG: carbohydrate ABC transporter permease [Azospirillaceae bacterium]